MPAFPKRALLRVGVVATPKGLRFLRAPRVPCDLIELRLDHLLARAAPSGLVLDALAARRHPVLFTLRAPGEGGAVPVSDADRAAILPLFLPRIDALDVELAHATALAGALAAARARRIPLILSAHFFRKAPDAATLQATLRAMRLHRPGISKIAAFCPSQAALSVLLAVQREHRHRHVALMGMGPLAGESRIALAAAGACLTYGYLDAPTAPGQPSAASLPNAL